jgi:hypothetical protein
MGSATCDDCGLAISASANVCPHCARPGRFPNVRVAKEVEESDALTARYDAAMAALTARGTRAAGEALEETVRTRSQAVIARPIGEIERIASSDRQGYASFYELVEAGIRIPDEEGWDVWRKSADTLFFPHYEKQMRFASLTLNGRGMPHYGDGFLVLRDDMVAHRATVFEENSAAFVRRETLNPDSFPAAVRGRRATWSDRGRLAVVKHHAELSATSASTDAAIAAILQRPGHSAGADDVFVEAHIYGGFTVRSLARVVVQSSKVLSKARFRALREKLAKLGVPLEEAS